MKQKMVIKVKNAALVSISKTSFMNLVNTIINNNKYLCINYQPLGHCKHMQHFNPQYYRCCA